MIFTFPAYHKIAPAQLDGDGFVENVSYPTCDNRGAGAGPAGKGLSGAPFKHAQADTAAIHDFHEPDIHAVREARMRFDGGAQPGNRR